MVICCMVQFQTWDDVVAVEDGGGGEGTSRGEDRQRNNRLAFEVYMYQLLHTLMHTHTHHPIWKASSFSIWRYHYIGNIAHNV